MKIRQECQLDIRHKLIALRDIKNESYLIHYLLYAIARQTVPLPKKVHFAILLRMSGNTLSKVSKYRHVKIT